MELTVIGAYGRNYNNQTDARKDWEDGKDFKIAGGPYMSIRDTEGEQLAITRVELRYGPLHKKVMVLFP